MVNLLTEVEARRRRRKFFGLEIANCAQQKPKNVHLKVLVYRPAPGSETLSSKLADYNRHAAGVGKFEVRNNYHRPAVLAVAVEKNLKIPNIAI